MKVKETIERECCAPQDLRPYMGLRIRDNSVRRETPIKFCIYCGQAWAEDRVMDAAGSTDTVDRKVAI